MKLTSSIYHLKSKPGFTLVEMLMVMGVMSILVVILSQVFGSILTMKLRSEATTAVSQDSRYLLSRLYYDISRASDIVSGSGATLTLTIGGDSYVYAQNGDTLTLAINGGTGESLTSVRSRVTDLSFTRTDLGLKKGVQIHLIMTPIIALPGGANLSRELTTTVALR